MVLCNPQLTLTLTLTLISYRPRPSLSLFLFSITLFSRAVSSTFSPIFLLLPRRRTFYSFIHFLPSLSPRREISIFLLRTKLFFQENNSEIPPSFFFSALLHPMNCSPAPPREQNWCERWKSTNPGTNPDPPKPETEPEPPESSKALKHQSSKNHNLPITYLLTYLLV